MRFIFPHGPQCVPHTSLIGFVYKKSLTADMTSLYEPFSPPFYIYICVCVCVCAKPVPPTRLSW